MTVLWQAADRICGKRLKQAIPTFITAMERFWCKLEQFGWIAIMAWNDGS
jgi:hypothetical protein